MQKKAVKEEQRKKINETYRKQKVMTVINSTISIIILNGNILNNLIERQKV